MERKKNIPKIVHYCWFGSKRMNKLQRRCLDSWDKHLTNYQFKKWDESNVDLSHPFLRTAYDNEKWAFVADYVRLQKLKEFGGIYLDTDMLVLKPLDKMLYEFCFFGAEDTKFIAAGIVGSVKDHPFIRQCFEKYDNIKLEEDINWFELTIPRLITKEYQIWHSDLDIIHFNKMARKKHITIYPSSFFYPLPYSSRSDIKNYKAYLTDDSYAIHLWNESWLDYNEFQHFRRKNYWKGMELVMRKILYDKKFSWNYSRKILWSIKNSFKK